MFDTGWIAISYDTGKYNRTISRSKDVQQNGCLAFTPGISNHMPSKVWDEITYPFLTFNGATVEV